MSKRGETQAKAERIINNGVALSLVDLALHLGLTVGGARAAAEALVAKGRIQRAKTVGGIVLYGKLPSWGRIIAAAQPEGYKPASLWGRFMEWVRQ